MKSKFLKELHRKTLQNYMDILILSKLQDGALSGYDIISYMHKKYGILVSSGTVYSLLYSMERKGYIEGKMASRKRLYSLTEKEDKNTIKRTDCELQNFLRKITLLETF